MPILVYLDALDYSGLATAPRSRAARSARASATERSARFDGPSTLNGFISFA